MRNEEYKAAISELHRIMRQIGNFQYSDFIDKDELNSLKDSLPKELKKQYHAHVHAIDTLYGEKKYEEVKEKIQKIKELMAQIYKDEIKTKLILYYTHLEDDCDNKIIENKVDSLMKSAEECLEHQDNNKARSILFKARQLLESEQINYRNSRLIKELTDKINLI